MVVLERLRLKALVCLTLVLLQGPKIQLNGDDDGPQLGVVFAAAAAAPVTQQYSWDVQEQSTDLSMGKGDTPSHPRQRRHPQSSSSSSSSSSQLHNHQHNSRPHQFQRRLQTTVGDASSTAGRIRESVLSNYDRNSYPWEYVWGQQQNTSNTASDTMNRTGIDVNIGLNFHKVHALDVTESTVDLIVWVRISWNDPRLRWDPESYDNLTKTWFWIEEGMGGMKHPKYGHQTSTYGIKRNLCTRR